MLQYATLSSYHTTMLCYITEGKYRYMREAIYSAAHALESQ